MRARTANVMLIFSNISQQREKTESADDVQGLIGAKIVERGFEFAASKNVVVAAETYTQLTYAFDQLVGFRALLVAHPRGSRRTSQRR